MSPDKPRRYRSPRRAAQAAETRRQIVEAAHRLFAERGLGSTSIADVARAAGVAAPTIYASFASKAGLLLAILDELTAAAGMAEMQDALRTHSDDPRAQLAAYVHFDRTLFETGRDIIGVGLGARSDPEIESWFAEGERRRRAGQAPVVHAWHRAGALRPGLGARRAADILWSLTGPAVYQLFVVESGWSPSAFERWLRDLLEGLLLA
jgi:AcrR family transcriptional regulator